MVLHSLIHLDKRVELYKKIKASFPDQIPIIVERAPGADAPNIRKKKFLSPPDITIETFLEEVREQIEFDSSEKEVIDFLFDTPRGIIAPQFCIIFYLIHFLFFLIAQIVGNSYETNKFTDGFLYVIYSKQKVFG